MAVHPPFVNAGNAGPFTLDGTRSYRVGRQEAVLLDPGPDVERHVRALLVWLEDASRVHVVVTHGHADHAAGARKVADALGVAVRGPAEVSEVDEPLTHGDRLGTDQGTLRAVDTPGHARQHLSLLWEEQEAVFVGDLMLGTGDTTWVGEYPGCVADYLESLRAVRRLAPRVIYPAHGPPLEDAEEALDRYEAHRLARIRQVEEALATRPTATVDDLIRVVYGDQLPSAVHAAARASLEALVAHVRDARPA